MALESITLGGGCFWCTEAVYEQVDGVLSVESGYSNGHTRHPSYQQVCGGDTGHNEVVRVTFDNQHISLREVLEIFFAVHDPTTLNRQGNDAGTQYRSAIFYHSEAQKATAQDIMAEVTREGLYRDPIVTEVTAAGFDLTRNVAVGNSVADADDHGWASSGSYKSRL